MQPSITTTGALHPESDKREVYAGRGSARRAELATLGTIAVAHGESLLSLHELDRLETLCRAVELEAVHDGDSGDKHTLQVGRLLKAPPGQSPHGVSDATDEVVRILGGSRLTGYLQGLLDTRDRIFLRRGQVNVISSGGFVGPHVDRDADPDYQLVVILHLTCDYAGGTYVVELQGGERAANVIKFRPEPHTILIGRTDVNHWVETITEGERRTLVMFASTYGGPNRKQVD